MAAQFSGVLAALGGTALVLSAFPANASPVTPTGLPGPGYERIPSLFNTGVDANYSPRANDAGSDLHYTLNGPAPVLAIGAPLATTIYASVGNKYTPPVGPYAGNDAVSAWIGPRDHNSSPAGFYVYTTTFSLSGFVPSTTYIYGAWGTDNVGVDIYVNGLSMSIHNDHQPTSGNWTTLTPFTYFPPGGGSVFDAPLQTNFHVGTNYLQFVVSNDAGPTGLRVQLEGYAQSLSGVGTQLVPEPMSLALLAAGLAGLAATRRPGKRDAA